MNRPSVYRMTGPWATSIDNVAPNTIHHLLPKAAPWDLFPLSCCFDSIDFVSVFTSNPLHQSISGGLFRIVLEYPLSLRHPFAQALSLLRRVPLLGAIEFACGARERLDPAGPRKPERFVQLQAARNFARRTSFQKYSKRDCIFNRLTGTLANVGDHGMRRIAHERDTRGRPVGQRSTIVDAPAKGFLERVDGIHDRLVPAGIRGGQRLEVTRRRPGLFRIGIGGNESHHVDQPPAGDGIKQEAPAGSEPKRGIPELLCPRKPLSGNQSPVSHGSFACRATFQANLALDDGTNSISADHEVGFGGSAIRERKMDPIAVFAEPRAAVAEIDRSFRERSKQQ